MTSWTTGAEPAVTEPPRAGRRWRPASLRAPERRWEIAAYLIALLAVSAALRTQAISAPLWADEGIAQGIASHSLGGVLDALRQDGSPPLYYVVLHAWMRWFGDTEASLHALSLLFALACVPAALWAGWTLFGRGTGLVAAALAAVNPYLSSYAQETRMYTLLSLLGIVAITAFVKAFVHRDRRAVAAFGATLALMAYTHNWALFFAAAAAVAVLLLARRAPDRRALLRDAALAFGGAAVLYVPWVPTLASQLAHTGAPWASAPTVAAPLELARGVFGGVGPAIALIAAAGTGIFALARESDGLAARSALVIAGLAAGTLGLAWVASQVSPAWSSRYFGTVLGALLLVAAAGVARGRALGLGLLALVVALWIPLPSPSTLTNKSNADVIAATIGPRLRPGDHVLSLQPEQVPLLRYYLPPGLRYADPRGPVSDPRVMDWRDALDDLRRADPHRTLAALLERVPPSGHVLFVAPVTEERRDWRAPWTRLVRRRSAQWGGLLEDTAGMRQIATAPLFYRQALAIGLRAVLYRKAAATRAAGQR
ncbi:MAG: glycosyltransferase family 39 protein [Solirubrobacteraceae bacterium]